VRVHLAAEHALEFELPNFGFDRGKVTLDLACRALIVLGFGEFEQLRRVAHGAGGRVDLGEFGLEFGTLATELLSLLGLLPDGRIFEFAADFLEPLALQIVFKETPLRS